MAGAGVRLFVAGNILTAQQVNEYLQDQVVARFADAAARDAAFGGLGEPVLSEGRLCYLDSDNTVYIYDGSAWVELQSGIPGTAGQVVVYNSSGDPIAQTLTGDVTISSSAVTSIAAGAIVNADINNSAAIAHSKLANITAGSVLIGNASNVPTATALSGDVTVTSSGVTAIGSGVIVNADINASAAIDKTKISGTAITAADTGTVTSTMIADGTIVNADINASAAIALSKLASGTSGQIIVANSSGVPTWVSETGDVTISDTGVTAISSGVIVDADVNANAAIAHSKLANITAGSVLIGNASNVPTATALSGDVTVTSSGVTAIGSGVIVNADINASAAIDKTKISGTAITAADTGTVTSTMIADGTIVNVDVSASAAISLSKLATSTSSQLASIISDETGSGALVFGTAPTITPAEGTTTNAHNGAGYMGMPQVSLSVGRTLNATDAGKHIYVTAGSQTITIPANTVTAFPVGTTIVVVTANGISTSIAINTDTLRLANSSSTGTRTVASNGMATLLKINTTEWICSGNGVT